MATPFQRFGRLRCPSEFRHVRSSACRYGCTPSQIAVDAAGHSCVGMKHEDGRSQAALNAPLVDRKSRRCLSNNSAAMKDGAVWIVRPEPQSVPPTPLLHFEAL